MKRNPDLECLITPLPPPVRLVSLYKGSFGLILQKIGYTTNENDVKKLRLQSVEVRRASVGQYGLVTTDGVTVLSRSLNGRPSWTLATFYGVTTQSKMKSNGVASTSEVRLFFS